MSSPSDTETFEDWAGREWKAAIDRCTELEDLDVIFARAVIERCAEIAESDHFASVLCGMQTDVQACIVARIRRFAAGEKT